MARIRSIFPGQWTDEDFVECSATARLLALALRNESDDQGVFEWKPVGLKMRLMPADGADINELLDELVEHRQIMRYEIGGRVYGAIRNFMVWQRPKKPRALHPTTPEVLNWVGKGRRSPDGGSEPADDDPPRGSGPVRNERGNERLPVPHRAGTDNASSATNSEPVPNGCGTRAASPSPSSEPVPNQFGIHSADRRREEVGGKREVSSRSGAAAAFTRARASTRDGPPPPEDDRDLDSGVQAAVSTVKTAVSKAFETWFDLPDRPISPSDEELFAAWIAEGTGRGVSADAVARAAAEEVDRQFRRMSERKPDDPPRRLSAVLDEDVRRAVAQAAATRSARPSSPPVVVPSPWAERFDATTYRTWIAPIVDEIVVDEGKAVITVPNILSRDWIGGRFEADIRHCLGVNEIEVVVAKAVEAA